MRKEKFNVLANETFYGNNALFNQNKNQKKIKKKNVTQTQKLTCRTIIHV